jgi:hypothetical protein
MGKARSLEISLYGQHFMILSANVFKHHYISVWVRAFCEEPRLYLELTRHTRRPWVVKEYAMAMSAKAKMRV